MPDSVAMGQVSPKRKPPHRGFDFLKPPEGRTTSLGVGCAGPRGLALPPTKCCLQLWHQPNLPLDAAGWALLDSVRLVIVVRADATATAFVVVIAALKMPVVVAAAKRESEVGLLILGLLTNPVPLL